MTETEIAVVGAGCRFPDAWGPQEYWQNIQKGFVSMRELSDEYLRSVGVPDDILGDPAFVRVAATLPGAENFHARFFGYTPVEAEAIDPQQRIFLEVCWEALESAAHPPAKDGPVVGVFAGGAPSTYTAALFAARAQQEGLAAAIDDVGLHLGGLGDFLTSRVAYKLGLRGPSVGVQTACSSSLYAVHYAMLSLLSGECDIALAGGSTVNEPHFGYRYQAGGLMSQDGFCRSFDARSTGTVFSSGVGVVVLRRLADALADGDDVLAILRGSAVGNDGAARSGFTAPNPSGVADVVAAALRVADVSADQLRYVEAHGSGTAIGDHIELRGLTDGLRATTRRSQFCGLGSVKVNVGHPGPAAGIAGLIIAVQVARTGVLPPHAMFERPRDPGLLAESPFYVSTTAETSKDPDRHVLVNSMGLGGTNVSVVVAPPPAPLRQAAPEQQVVRLVVSARSRSELDTLSRKLAHELEQPTAPLADIAHTLRVGRSHFEERRVVTASADRLAATLRLPRPPAAQTVRSTPTTALVVLPAGTESAPLVVERLQRVFGGRAEVVPGPLTSVPPGRFQILFDHGEPGADRHVLHVGDGADAEALADRLEAAVAAAWLHGVDVDWEALSSGRGRRVPLPTYPFERRRHWALDRLPPVARAPVTASSPACAVPTPARRAEAPAPAAGSVQDDLLSMWRDLFGIDDIGVDDEFGVLGGTSLLSVHMALDIQQRHGVLVNLHRAGGSKATIRRIAEIIEGKQAGAERGSAGIDPVADGDLDLVDDDIMLPLGPLNPAEGPGTDVLLTGATGFLGTFLLNELLKSTQGRVYCVVRADDDAQARGRLREGAAKFALPEPDFDRVTPVLGDLRDIGQLAEGYNAGELARRIGHVVHCAARVVFIEPYRVLRDDNVLPMVDLLRWMRSQGIRDFSFVSTVAACGYALGTDSKIVETREQPLDPQQGGYGVSKWVSERILERAELDGMRVRVFRPGFILASTATSACNEKDLIWHILASGLAVGAHPMDDRALPMAPVDVVARGIAELAMSPGSVGRAYHLVSRRSVTPRGMFELLAEAGLPTKAVPSEEWQQLVAGQALATGSEVLSNMALYESEGHQLGEEDLEAVGWQPWLEARGLVAAPDGELLREGLAFLRRGRTPIGALLRDIAARPVDQRA